MKILIVAPHWRSRRSLRDLLSAGLRAAYFEADGPAEAKSVLLHESPDVVLVAEPDETEPLERFIRATGEPVVVFGKARAGSRRATHWVSAGAAAYVSRPIPASELAGVVRSLGEARTAAAPEAPNATVVDDWLDGLFEYLRGHLARAQYLDRR